MLYSTKANLEDKLVEALLGGPASIKKLRAIVSTPENVASLRGVYKAVSSLIDAGVLLKVGKQIWINQQWARNLRERLATSIPFLSPGERAVYIFNSVQHLDVFWKTIAFQFEEHEQSGRIFFYNPHNFWAYIPELKESENEYYAHFAKTKKRAFFTVGGATEADRAFKREYQNEFLQIDVRDVPSLGRRDHITILGDFVITARMSQKLAKQLDNIYSSGESVEMSMQKILTAYRADANVRLTIEYNGLKAKKLIKLLSPHFVL